MGNLGPIITGVPGKGGYRAALDGCENFGHPLVPDPRNPERLRKCSECARRRANEQYAILAYAAQLSGLTNKRYFKIYGHSAKRALQHIARLETEGPATGSANARLRPRLRKLPDATAEDADQRPTALAQPAAKFSHAVPQTALPEHCGGPQLQLEDAVTKDVALRAAPRR